MYAQIRIQFFVSASAISYEFSYWPVIPCAACITEFWISLVPVNLQIPKMGV